MTLFIEPAKAKEYECSVCLEIYKEPVQIGCEEHIFCKQCVDELISQQHGSFQCPLCRTECSPNNVTRVRFISRQINALKVQCNNVVENKKHINVGISLRKSARLKTKQENSIQTINDSNNGCGRKRKRSAAFGKENKNTNSNNKQRKLNQNEIFETCKWIGAYSDLDNHIKTCPLQKVLCKYCKDYILRRDEQKHFEVCQFVPIACVQCGRPRIPRRQMELHVIDYCPMTKIKCRKCEQIITRKTIKSHVDNDCPETLIKCAFYEFGCKEKLKRKDEKNHIESAAITHTHLVQIGHTVNNLKAENEKLMLKICNLEFLYAKVDRLENLQNATMNVLQNKQTQFANQVTAKINGMIKSFNQMQQVTAAIIPQLPTQNNNVQHHQPSAAPPINNPWQQIINAGIQWVPQWVQCKLCKKWRVMNASTNNIITWKQPYGWQCSMGTAPNNRCVVPQEEPDESKYTELQLTALTIQRQIKIQQSKQK